MSTIYEMQMANLFPGDDDPANSKHLILENVKCPSIQESVRKHSPGGAIMTIELGMRYYELGKLSFRLRGIDESTMRQIGINSPNRRKYTIRGNVVDMRSGDEIAAKAIVEGRLIKVDMENFEREKGVSIDYEVAEMVHYEFILGTQEIYYFNFFEGPAGMRINAVPTFANAARNLGLA